ncbi:MAG TPA: hypothetical protein V6C86_22990 [Oculatellaceae cyanobacterium]
MSKLKQAAHCDTTTLLRSVEECEALTPQPSAQFALSCDLTTSVQISDVLLIDMSNPYDRRLSVLELKAGRVNEELTEVLADPDFCSRYVYFKYGEKGIKQVLRMLKQEINCAQAVNTINNDQGIDLRTNKYIHMSEPTQPLSDYSEILQSLIERAQVSGAATDTIDECLHLAAVSTSDSNSLEIAQHLLAAQVHEYSRRTAGISAIAQEVITAVGKERLKINDFLDCNLHAVGSIPFTSWNLNVDSITDLARRNTLVLFALDIYGLFALCHRLRIQARLKSRKETAKLVEELGPQCVTSWNNRTLEVEGHTLLTGSYSKMINELFTPMSVILNIIDKPEPKIILAA